MILFLILGAGEMYVRTTTRTPFLGNSRNLFSANRFKSSYGHTPGITAVSFGQVVYIDANGFRAAERATGRSNNIESERLTLVVGDSVAFGPGVPEEQTFVGLLRKELPDRQFLNTAVIGYSTLDYLNVFTSLLEMGIRPKRILLFYCLNDVWPTSAESIRRILREDIASDQSISSVDWINEFLRERSKLYLILKNWLTNPRRRYFFSDAAAYANLTIVAEQLQPLFELARRADEANIAFTIFIVPYAYQLTPEGRSHLGPQAVLTEILRKNQVDFVDLFLPFASASGDPFLPGDPMHLSVEGHKLVSQVVRRVLLSRDQVRDKTVRTPTPR
jgi:lysophospholipase L1-like esterase